MKKHEKKGLNYLNYLRIALVIGMLLSSFLVYEHFKTESTEFCNFGAGLNCDVVNKSPYANLDGIFYLMTFEFHWNTVYLNISNSHWIPDLLTSNAFLGFLTLLFIYFLTTKLKTGWKCIKTDKVISWIRGLLIFGVGYGFLLLLIQHFVIESYCIFCISLDIEMVVALVMSYKLKVKK